MWDYGAQSGTSFYRKIPHFLLGGTAKSHPKKIVQWASRKKRISYDFSFLRR